MSDTTPPDSNLHLVVGYDDSPAAERALDATVRLLQGRTGQINVLYVAHMPSTTILSADALAEMESGFDEVEQELRRVADTRLRGLEERWRFERRQGVIADELMEVAKEIRDAHPSDVVAIVVGSSSHAMHRVVGSVAVSLARHSPVPLVIVP